MKELKKFRHRMPVQLRFSDFDLLGHINNVRYLSFYEDARIDYLAKTVRLSTDKATIKAIVAHIETDFLKAVFPGEKIEVYTRCAHIGKKSFRLESVVVRLASEKNPAPEIVNRSQTVLVAYDHIRKTSMPIAEHDKQAILNFENPEKQPAEMPANKH